LDIRLPPKAPGEVLELIGFFEQLNARMREMRDTTALPRSAVTLPDEFDGVVAQIWEHLRAQAEAALAAGESLVEIRLARTEPIVALARWAEPRMEIVTGLTRAGMVQAEWERPLKLMLEIFEATLGQIDNGE
jgi:hypothetical protein